MCGIAGCINKSDLSKEDLRNLMGQMSESLKRRGPDGCGQWIDKLDRAAFSHSRLAILDLSSAGHQPMMSPSSRYVITFNGEIYNHLELRVMLEEESLDLILWSGQSDTETLLHAIEFWGLEKSLTLIAGQFAFALWDDQEQTLSLCRDRFGEKPLYYGVIDGSLAFASELKALKKFPRFNNKISTEAVTEYIQFNYIPCPMSIYQDIFKLEPGCCLTINVNNLEQKLDYYWSSKEAVETAKQEEIFDEVDALCLIEEALESSVKSQMISDVPLGAFLSGGIDSSLIVALMQKLSDKPVKTFTIGFQDSSYDESKFAQAVADHLKTDHSTMLVTDEEVLSVIKSLPLMYDEPFADSSQIPTYLVSKAAKKQVTVALSGDAGDEIFGGYNRYLWVPKIWRLLQWVPFFLRQSIAKSFQLITIESWNKFFQPFKVNRPGEKIHKLASALKDAQSSQDLYFNLVRQWKDPASILRGLSKASNQKNKFLASKFIVDSNIDLSESMMFADTMSYLPDDILAKVDRASMFASLETRAPFLDKNVFESAWRLSGCLKIHKGTTKTPLRKILRKYIPDSYIDRPKIGFSLPIGDWLRGPLRSWADSLLDKEKLQREGFFYPNPIHEVWQEHLSGISDHSAKLWGILMFQAWLELESKEQLTSSKLR